MIPFLRLQTFFLLFLISMSIHAFGQIPTNWMDDSGINTFKETSTVYEGDFSCGIDVNTGTQANCDLSNLVEIPVVAGESFKISFYYFTSEHVRLRAAFDWVGFDATYSPNYAGPTTTGDWEEFVCEDIVPVDVTGVNLRIRSYDIGGFVAPETQFVDQIIFESPVGNVLYVANGNFEEWPSLLPEPTNYPTEFSATATDQQIELLWTDATGGQLPDAYLIMASDENVFTPPSDADFIANDLDLTDGQGAANVLYGEEEFIFANLNPETTYYFQIYPYTNFGLDVDYKTDGTAPSSEATTGAVLPEIVVTAPETGENWFRGQVYDVEWNVINVEGDVTIEITDDASSGNPVWTLLATVPASSESFSWQIPSEYPIGNDYQFRVSSLQVAALGLSGIFSIVDEPDFYNIVINEIMYNPPAALGDDDYWEYLEIYNNDTENVDLSGWSFTDGFEFIFADGTILNAGEYLLIARNPDTISAFYGISNLVGPFIDGALSNGGENVELSDAFGNVVDTVDYSDGGEWPSEPDGDGPSLSLIDPDFDNSLPESWEASIILYGTPGLPNNPTEPIIVVIFPNGGEMLQQGLSYEIIWNYAEVSGEVTIELINLSGSNEILASSVEVTTQSWIWEVAEGQELGDDYKIKIYSNDNNQIFDESDAIFSIIEMQPVPNLVITEIMYNPPESNNDSLEFIEIYNNDNIDVNLAGFSFVEGIEFTFAETTLNAGDYILVAVDSLAMLNVFDVNAFEWTGGALSNGGELIELQDGFGNIIDQVEYDDQLPWDTLADGGGPSLTLCDPDSDNSLPENWLASAEFAAVNSEGDSIYATPGEPCLTTEIQNIENETVHFYPNPNRGVFFFNAENSGIWNIEVYDLTGNRIYCATIESGEVIDITTKTSHGIYFIKATNILSHQVFSTKMIIKR